MIRVEDVCVDGVRARVARADDLSDIAAACRDLPPKTDMTWNEAIRGAERGDKSHVAAAEALIAQLECSVDAPRSIWAPSRAGAYPIVPETLAGFPDAMRRRVPASDDRSPLKVTIDLTSSAGIDRADLARRGVAYLALAMFLSNERPVTLEAVVGLGGPRGTAVFVVTRIPTQPLDLATACFALASTAFSRSLGYSLCHALDKHCTGSWPWGITPFCGGSVNPEFVRKERLVLGLEPDDVLAPPLYLTDPAVKDPVGFVRRAIDDHKRINDER